MRVDDNTEEMGHMYFVHLKKSWDVSAIIQKDGRRNIQQWALNE